MIDKIIKRLKVIFDDFIIDSKYFSFKLAIVRFINNVTCRGRFLKKINKWSVNEKHKLILNYLSINYADIINKYKSEEESAEYLDKQNIWVCWLQGEKNAPQLVKNCIDSIRCHSNGHEVIIISRDNFSRYIDIPNYILDKYDKGIISHAHFSDIIRMSLLCAHGGIWIDATVFCSKDLPHSIFEKTFFSCKGPFVETDYISGMQWTSFILGGKRNSLLYRYILDFYFQYWKNEDYAIDYLFMDYMIYLAYNNIKNIKKAIDQNEINNTRRDGLYNIFNQKFSLDKYKNFLDSDTYLYKLSWRETFDSKTTDGKDTFYNVFINKYSETFS
ncbi:capsular polysaccharide synthesis protein [Terrisporobacter glycolicus]|uniref:capsular polysaccharide synthesis protein n=1 Tax=Terrisporobacter glycolicus TaxID=36841 RepID=UPI003464B5BB